MGINSVDWEEAKRSEPFSPALCSECTMEIRKLYTSIEINFRPNQVFRSHCFVVPGISSKRRAENIRAPRLVR